MFCSIFKLVHLWVRQDICMRCEHIGGDLLLAQEVVSTY